MRLRNLSIIQYQNVTPEAHLHRLWLSLNAFQKQLAFFLDNNFRFLGIDDAIRFMKREIHASPQRPISLSFDNGFLDFYEKVFPLLLSKNIPATVLVSPEKVGQQIKYGNRSVRYMNWDHLREINRHGVAIGAYEDENWDINRIPLNLVEKHIREYKPILEEQVEIEIPYFGVKEGVPCPQVRQILINCGYRAFLTQCPTFRRPDLYAVGRIQVDDEDFNIFVTKISNTYLFFKDKRSWRLIRKSGMDRLVHRVSEAYNRSKKNLSGDS